jgi:nicotinamidase-related amidase
MSRTDLVIIDGQNDFLHQDGSLLVPGAKEEAVEAASMIEGNIDAFDMIHASLDEHHKNDGSHNTHWRDRNGNIVPPFTIVGHDDVQNQKYRPGFRFGVWKGKTVTAREWALNYTEALEKEGRAPLCLWPVHCQIGTWGANIYEPLRKAYDAWCDATGGWIDFISKGTWAWTEHYSALKADVPDPTQPQTQLNSAVINNVAGANRVIWFGWAGSHCLPWTAYDGVNYFEPSDAEKANGAKNEFIAKCIFLEDACAPVPNPPGGVPDFVQARRDFLDEMDSRGATISTTKDVFKLL